MGTVYRAEHATIGKQVAIKVLQKHFAHMPEVLARFIREAKAVNDIRHENVIDILGFDHTADQEPYILMEYLEGRTLSDAVEAEAPFSTERTVHLALQICSALFAAHELGIIHRDLKGDNVFLTKKRSKKDFVKLIDFGIAKLMSNDLASSGQTRTGAFVGTPICTAPEQADGGRVDARTDIYALGVLLHQMATGAPPFYDKNPHLLIVLHLTAALPPPSSRFADISPALEAIIMKCLAKKQKDRFASMKEVATALAKITRRNLADYYFPEDTRQVNLESLQTKKPEPSTAVDIRVEATQITPAPEGLRLPPEPVLLLKATTDSIPAGEAFLPTKKPSKHTWKLGALAALLLLGFAYGLMLPSGAPPPIAPTPTKKALPLLPAPAPVLLNTPESEPALPTPTEPKITKSPSTKPSKLNKPKTLNSPVDVAPKEPVFKPKIPFNSPK